MTACTPLFTGMLAYGGDSSVKGKHHQMTGGGSDLAKARDTA